jgi:cytochrome c oxidase subunit III
VKVIGDLAHLPAAGFRTHGLWYWGALWFMAIEGAAFVLAYASYLYLMSLAELWPLRDPPPDLEWATLNTLIMLASLWPAHLLSKAARKRDLRATQRLGVVLAVINAAVVVIRFFELPNLNTRWDHDAYGSIVWALMLMHTLHLLTDFLETLMLTIFSYTHPVDTERFSDIDDDVGYWGFVVATWLPIYLLVFWAPRWS